MSFNRLMAKQIHPYHIVLLSSKKKINSLIYKIIWMFIQIILQGWKKKPVPKSLHTIMITSMQHSLNDKIIEMEDRLAAARS